MNHIQLILKAIRRVRNRILINRVILRTICGGIVGMVTGLAVLLLSVWVPYYYAVHLAVAAASLGLLAGACYGVMTRPTLSRAALAADRAGMGECLITALEFKDSDRVFHRLQREQAAERLARFNIKAAFPVRVPVKECLAFGLSACLCVVCAMVPAAARDIAQERHEVQAMIGEETAKIEKVLDMVEEDAAMSELSNELRDELTGLLNEAMAEMENAESMEELEKGKERLEKKLENALDGAGVQDAASLSLKLADELGLPGTMREQQMLSELEDSIREALEGAGSSLTEEQLEELAKQLSEQMQNGGASQSFMAEAAEMLGMDEEALREALDEEIARRNAAGNGEQGSGDGTGGADGDGDGNPDGESGQGYDMGSKTGIEKDSSAIGSAEELEIPGRALGEDRNLTGTTTGGQSYFVETRDGLAWSGRKVDYNEVIGSYASEARNRINNSEVPNDMKEIVRDYFSGLTDRGQQAQEEEERYG